MPPNTSYIYQSQQPEQQLYNNEPTVETLPAQVFEFIQTNGSPYSEEVQQATSQLQTAQVGAESQLATPIVATGSTPFYYYVLYLLGAFFLFFLVRKIIQMWKGKFKFTLPPLQSLYTKDNIMPCSACGGLGKTTIKEKKFTPCKHCKETGTDICHYCGGTGEYSGGYMIPETKEEAESFMKCDYCSGTGFTTPSLLCCMCKGKKVEEYEETSEVTCAECKGTGKI